jgi:hypothetical protein
LDHDVLENEKPHANGFGNEEKRQRRPHAFRPPFLEDASASQLDCLSEIVLGATEEEASDVLDRRCLALPIARRCRWLDARLAGSFSGRGRVTALDGHGRGVRGETEKEGHDEEDVEALRDVVGARDVDEGADLPERTNRRISLARRRGEGEGKKLTSLQTDQANEKNTTNLNTDQDDPSSSPTRSART